MRPAGIYLVQAQIGAARITNIPQGDILLTLRIGRNYASANYSRTSATSPIIFNTTLQVNVDSSALDTQRCSLTMSMNTPNDKRMIGIALISVPKDKNHISNSYRLTQNEDKKAEVDIQIKIVNIDNSSVRSPTTLGINSETAKLDQPKTEPDPIKEAQENSTSNIKLKSKASQERSGSTSQINKVPLKNYHTKGDKMIEVSESEVKRYKDEKDVYYQMYQIQKSKNEVASRFISTFIKKLTEKFPHLVPNQVDLAQSTKRNGKSQQKTKQADNSAAIAQLEQANRSLHRQIDQYKKVVEQLKQQISSNTKNAQEGYNRKNNLLPPSFIDLAIVPKQSYRQRSSIIPSSLKEPHPSASVQAKTVNDLQKELRQTFAGLDLKKWLEQSIEQRENLQTKLTPSSTMQQDRSEGKTNFIKKLRSGIDKAFAQLITSKDLTKAALLTHKQEVNRLLDENTY